ncbi:MAG TPA: beta-propeller domain-containing protein, partial [Candidatus Norongarragalinales archaeon]|nr:beta-propeller domain-containing protein [Candidatus Norongarragalinales archaeon]
MKGLVQWIAALAVVFLVSIFLFSSVKQPVPGVSPTPELIPTPVSVPTLLTPSWNLKTFQSFDEISSFLSSASASSGSYGARGFNEALPMMAAPLAADSAGAAKSASDYSPTNIQVEGVDEPDTFKTDGKYIYTLSGGSLVLLDAYPAENLRVLSELNDSMYSGLFINGDRMVAFGTSAFDWDPIVKPLEEKYAVPEGPNPAGSVSSKMIAPDYYPRYFQDSAFIKIFDVSDRAQPKLLKTIQSKGNYQGARMIGKKIYAIFSEYASYGIPRPLYAVDGSVREFSASEIGYFDTPFESYQFTTVLGIDLDDWAKTESRKVVLMGAGQTLYVSKDAAYISYTQSGIYLPVWKAFDEALFPFPTDIQEKLNAIDDSDVSDWRKDNLKVRVAQ